MSSSRQANLRCSCCGQTSVVRQSNSRGNTETVRCRFTRPRVGIIMRIMLHHRWELSNLQLHWDVRSLGHLLQEKRYSGYRTLILNGERPSRVHVADVGVLALLTCNNDPRLLP